VAEIGIQAGCINFDERVLDVTKVALFGCGAWGRNLARNLAGLDALKLIVDPSDAAQLVGEQLGIPVVADVEQALTDPEIVGIVVATPASTHFAVAAAAIAAGKDVYVEKPIALSVDEGRQMAAMAKAAGRILMVGHLLHYHPVYRALADLVQAGRLGRVRHITSSRMNLGMLRHEENVLWSFSPHDMSMVLGLVDEAPQAVATIGSDFFQPGVADVTTAHLRFASGLTADIRASWFNPEKDQKLVVVGDRAMAVFNDTAPWPEKLVIHDYHIEHIGPRPKAVRGEAETISVPQGEPLKLEMQHFLDCIATRTTPRTDAEEAIMVLGVLQAAQGSLDRRGEWVDV
jgi:UDP-2-acetamido-3-amino-2,3-dideoxy-glucuronate N-acetyltransferase